MLEHLKSKYLITIIISSIRVQIAKVDSSGVHIMEPFNLETKWDYEMFRNQVN